MPITARGNNGAFSTLALRICVPINCSGSLVRERSRRVQIKHLRRCVLECSPADICNTQRPTLSHVSPAAEFFSSRTLFVWTLLVCPGTPNSCKNIPGVRVCKWNLCKPVTHLVVAFGVYVFALRRRENEF